MDDPEYRVDQFKKFHSLLMANAPEEYQPWYFPLVKQGKDPNGIFIHSRANNKISCCGTEWVVIERKVEEKIYKKTICKKCGRTKGSWKQPWARLTFNQCVGLISAGYNIGLAARENDPLVILDIDKFCLKGSMPITLINKSRKRCGLHGFCWSKEKIPNIPTEDDGEVRAQDQYVVVSGYVPTSKEEIDKELNEGNITQEEYNTILQDPYLGLYTLQNEISPTWITYNDLPDFYRKEYEKQAQGNKAITKSVTISPKGKHSALFDLTIKDLVSVSINERVGHPLHASETSANFSISADCDDLAHCWRHNVSLNALQFLVVQSGYMGCSEAGTGHRGGTSRVTGDDGAIFYAWLEAKKCKLIPEDDPIPIRAMCYIALKHNIATVENLPKRDEKKSLPWKIYNNVLAVVENEY